MKGKRTPMLGRMMFGASVAAMAVAAQPAYAQDAAADEAEGNEIIVTGIRASLRDAADIKRNAIGVVDAISLKTLASSLIPTWPNRCSGSPAFRLIARAAKVQLSPFVGLAPHSTWS
jgi:hypothetical protein